MDVTPVTVSCWTCFRGCGYRLAKWLHFKYMCQIVSGRLVWYPNSRRKAGCAASAPRFLGIRSRQMGFTTLPF